MNPFVRGFQNSVGVFSLNTKLLCSSRKSEFPFTVELQTPSVRIYATAVMLYAAYNGNILLPSSPVYAPLIVQTVPAQILIQFLSHCEMLAKDLLQKRVREEENVRMSNTTLHNTRFIHLQQKLSYN